MVGGPILDADAGCCGRDRGADARTPDPRTARSRASSTLRCRGSTPRRRRSPAPGRQHDPLSHSTSDWVGQATTARSRTERPEASERTGRRTVRRRRSHGGISSAVTAIAPREPRRTRLLRHDRSRAWPRMGLPSRANLTAAMASEQRYDPRTIERKWQALWERERTWEVSNDELDAAHDEVLRARDAALPLGRAAHGPPEELRDRRRGRPFPAPLRPARAAPDGLRRLRPAGREPRDQDGRTPARLDRGVDRGVPAPVSRVGHLDRLVARVRHARAALLPLDPMDLPAALRARPGLPARGRRQLVPEGRHRARQRAGHRRPLRALRHAGRGPPARAVVLPHHRLRGPPARRPRDDSLARARQDDATQLDRSLRGRRGDVLLPGGRRRLPRVHDATRHACSARHSS